MRQDQVRKVFWMAFFALPLFTGFLSYDWLPQEYDERNHILIESHSVECGHEGLNSCDAPDVWKDRKTGRVYRESDFISHHRSESIRVAVLSFLYGLIACIFHAWDKKKAKAESFVVMFREALVINAIVSVVIFIVI